MTGKVKRKMGLDLQREEIIKSKRNNLFGLTINNCSNLPRCTSDLSMRENQAYRENIEQTRAETMAFALRMIPTIR